MSLINRMLPELRRASRLLDSAPLLRPLQRFPAAVLGDDPFFAAGPAAHMLRDVSAPLTDVKETEKEFVVEMEVPGYDKDNVSLEFVGDNGLRVTGHVERETKAPAEQQSEQSEHEHGKVGRKRKQAPSAERVLHSERVVADFERVVTFPSHVDTEHAAASMRNGVLRVSVPKSAAADKTRKLAIEG